VGIHADGLLSARPFRAPHHTISAAGLVGGGSPPSPGEATLAQGRVLLLDRRCSRVCGIRSPSRDVPVRLNALQMALRA
jgi:magnesium chelatase family protein